MRRHIRNNRGLTKLPALASLLLALFAGAARAQQTIFNVPTTDVLERGKVSFEPDATTLVPTFKLKVYDGSKRGGVAVVLGGDLFLPVRRRAYNAGSYVYAEVSKSFKSGTRLTAGGYDFTRHVVADANRAGGQFGFEQPVSKKLTLAADYFTGKHSAGYFTPGASFKLGPKATAYAGYSIGNQNASRGNHFFLLELGYNFN